MENQGQQIALIAGATGLVGRQLLSQLLSDPAYRMVIAVVRRPLEISHDKLSEKVIDFASLPEALSGLKADHGFCCLGTTLKTAGSKESQYRIDHDFVVAFAQGCHSSGVSRFAVVSSIGANAGSSNFYLRTKGEMERDLHKIPFTGLFILRPSLLLGDRKEYRAAEKAATIVMKLINPLMHGGLKKYRGIHASAVAHEMIRQIRSEETKVQIVTFHG